MRLLASCRASRGKTQAVEDAQGKQQPAPPDAGMKMKKNNRILRRMRQLIKAGRENKRSIHQQRNADEEPDRDGPAGEHGDYHTIILRNTNTTPTTAARNAGRL